MKNFKMNDLKKFMRRGFALVSAVFVVGSFSGCKEDVKTPTVEEQVSANIETQRQYIIEECIKDGNKRGLSETEININIYKELAKKGFLSESDAIHYHELLKEQSEESIVYSYTK